MDSALRQMSSGRQVKPVCVFVSWEGLFQGGAQSPCVE